MYPIAVAVVLSPGNDHACAWIDLWGSQEWQ